MNIEEAMDYDNAVSGKINKIRQEYETKMSQGFQEAYEMIQSERDKHESQSVEMYQYFEIKLHEIKSFIVEKVDQFITHKGEELHALGEDDFANRIEIWRQEKGAKAIVQEAIGEEDKAASDRVPELEAKCMKLEYELHKSQAKYIDLKHRVQTALYDAPTAKKPLTKQEKASHVVNEYWSNLKAQLHQGHVALKSVDIDNVHGT